MDGLDHWVCHDTLIVSSYTDPFHQGFEQVLVVVKRALEACQA